MSVDDFHVQKQAVFLNDTGIWSSEDTDGTTIPTWQVR